MVKIVMPGDKKKAAAAQASGPMMAPPDTESVSRRVKMLEERFTNSRSRVQMIEQNMLTKHKNIFSEIKTMNTELTEIKKEINELKDKIIILVKELESFSKREDVLILKKYIDLWNPMNFVTRKEVNEIVKEQLDSMHHD